MPTTPSGAHAVAASRSVASSGRSKGAFGYSRATAAGCPETGCVGTSDCWQWLQIAAATGTCSAQQGHILIIDPPEAEGSEPPLPNHGARSRVSRQVTDAALFQQHVPPFVLVGIAPFLILRAREQPAGERRAHQPRVPADLVVRRGLPQLDLGPVRDGADLENASLVLEPGRKDRQLAVHAAPVPGTVRVRAQRYRAVMKLPDAGASPQTAVVLGDQIEVGRSVRRADEEAAVLDVEVHVVETLGAGHGPERLHLDLAQVLAGRAAARGHKREDEQVSVHEVTLRRERRHAPHSIRGYP